MSLLLSRDGSGGKCPVGRRAGLGEIAAVVVLAALVGCTSVPFAEPVLPPLDERAPAAVAQAYREALPTRFTADVSMVIELPWHRLAVLGCLRVDRVAGTFELVGLSHLGFKLFQLAGDRQGVQVRFAAPVFAARTALLQALAEDCRRSYLELVPPDEAEVLTERDCLRFLVPGEDGGRVEYVFGGVGTHLLQKRVGHGWGRPWQVAFYEYGTESGGLFPRGIVVDNRQFGHRLIIKHRNWQLFGNQDAPPHS